MASQTKRKTIRSAQAEEAMDRVIAILQRLPSAQPPPKPEPSGTLPPAT